MVLPGGEQGQAGIEIGLAFAYLGSALFERLLAQG
ncbi:hypothetical protein SAMN05444724_1118 [Salinivibrio sp. ES.052]|nr:hypothetical protein SAMN05444724_1118 [Salinivibrio sp. ES.052]